MNLKSNNPFLNNKSVAKTTTVTEAYDAEGRPIHIIDYNNTMTINGAVNKTFILLVLLLFGAFTTWMMIMSGANYLIPTIGGAVLGFVAVLIASFKPSASPYLAPAYALFEGLFIGGISALFEAMYPGVVIKAVSATFVTFGVCLALYRFRIVKVTEQFRSVVMAATLAIATYYLISWILSFFINFTPVHSVQDNSLLGIGVSVFVVIIAALNIFLDLDFIEKGTERRLPKYMEWFGAMGLMVTLVWLYIEFLRLISKISGRD